MMRDLLKSLSTLSEAETKDTKTGRIHKGDYGTSHEAGDEGVKKQETSRGRGRPKKDADETGEVKNYDTKSIGNVFGAGKKPSKEVGTVSKKHSLKEYMEAAEEAIVEGTTIEKKGGRVHKGSYGTSYEAGDEGVKKAETTRGRGRPKKDADETGEVKKYDTKSLSAAFGGSKAPKKAIGKVSASHKLKETEALAIKPMPGASQITTPDGKPIATADAATANMMKQAAQQGKLSIGGQSDEMNEGAKPDFLDVDKDKNKKESFKKAVKDKEAKKKVAEGRDQEASEYLDEKIARILAREKPGMKAVSSNDEFYGAIYHELIACGLTPKAARYKVSYDEDFIADVASAYAHYQQNPSLDEGSIDDFRVDGVKPTNDFTTSGNSMAVPRGTPTTANRPVANPTPFGTDPIAATTDRAINFISGLRKPSNPFSESTNMKDMQVEGWAQQLNSILAEGITVSSSQGQQGAPDSVTITATEGDSDQLLQVLRQAGIGVFGGDEKPEFGYGVTQGGEEEPNGTGTAPQAAPTVVGDGDDMLSMMKKMAGIEDGTSGADMGSSEGEGQDYEDEAGALEPTDGEEEYSDEEGEEEVTDEGVAGAVVGGAAGAALGKTPTATIAGAELGSEVQDAFSGDDEDEVEEGNAFTGKLKQTPQGGNFKMGDKSYKDTSEIEEQAENCNECGCAMQEGHECETEQVEETFSNDAGGDAMGDTQMAQLKALLSMGNDMHKIKRSQAMGNPVKVTMETKLMNQSTGLLADYKKLSGL